MLSSQANSDTRSGETETETGVSRETPPLKIILFPHGNATKDTCISTKTVDLTGSAKKSKNIPGFEMKSLLLNLKLIDVEKCYP